MSSSSLPHPLFCLSISSLLLLLLLIQSAAGTLLPGNKAAASRVTYRRKRMTQSAQFVLAHNAARGTSGVSSLKWDKGLARFASDWAKQRKADCKMTHSGGPYGENIFWHQNSEKWSPKRVVAKWMQEGFNYDRTTNSCKLGEMCGHYTQIVWRTTTAVGCAREKCDNNRGFLVVCEYSPSGNYEGESPFDMPK
ncbi:hypothetical protein CARUB_v10002025mg [Capsella rubella]|uniref:SCP domain-containing protein n=1 Tax=Capsella rubella TaxID=81985 RepID=R0FH15_9BRAS|nr:pathogenesis-related protein PRB1-3 [Capsella rubella]EOA21612.1 hypothetical protein CARUB_v10002025mg [Capsella rubella]